MQALLVFLAAIGVVAASPEAPFQPAPNAMVAFNDGCDWSLASLDALPDDLEARGWRRFEPEVDSRLARHLSAVYPSGGEGRRLSFRSEVQGRAVFLMLAEEREAAGRIRRTCTLFDFDATELIALADLVPWAGRQPTRELGGPGEPLWGHAWEPGLSEGHERTEIYFVREAGPLRSSTHLTGMIFTATRTETDGL